MVEIGSCRISKNLVKFFKNFFSENFLIFRKIFGFMEPLTNPKKRFRRSPTKPDDQPKKPEKFDTNNLGLYPWGLKI